MDGVCLRFYTLEERKLHGMPVTDAAKADRLLGRVRDEAIALFYVRFAVERGWTREAPAR